MDPASADPHGIGEGRHDIPRPRTQTYLAPSQLQYPGVQTLPGAGGGGGVSTIAAGGVIPTEKQRSADNASGPAKRCASPHKAANCAR
jgi:hypothetical protein